MGDRIFVDWGTTSFRAYRVGEDGAVTGVKANELGVRAAQGRFEATLRAQIAPWLQQGDVSTILCAGMIGSDLGWRTVDMLPCPADLATMAANLHPVQTADLPDLFIVPGVSHIQADGSVGMMRGEEVLLFGGLALGDRSRGRFCFPGTHSKWVTVSGGAVKDIRTCMTGECFALLRYHSVLAPSLEPWSGDILEEHFLAGVATARLTKNPLQSAFSVRALHLHGRLPSPAARASYLSGVLIGAEVAGFADAELAGGDGLTIVCEPRLAALYKMACEFFSIDVALLDEERCFVTGAAAILSHSRERIGKMRPEASAGFRTVA